jgi:hypothetical protein
MGIEDFLKTRKKNLLDGKGKITVKEEHDRENKLHYPRIVYREIKRGESVVLIKMFT